MSENLLQLQAGGKAFGARILFRDAAFSLNAGEHVGVIGPNGAGKTTLLRIIAGEDALDDGQLTRSRSLRLAYLSQHDQWSAEETGNSYLERMTRIPIWELKARGRILQLDEATLARPLMSLSGGYRMRVKLLGLLGQEPNLMLLDEPTNYLDLETTLLLERFLQEFAGAFLLISHDREFLRRTTDHILEIETEQMTKFNGDIDDYFEQKQLLRTQLEARAATDADKRRVILDFVARFGAKATKARQAQSRLRTLAKMETIEVKALPVTSVIRIPAPTKIGRVAISLAEAEFGYGEKTVLRDVSLQIEQGDHVAVVGLNGAGKSTLLKGVSGGLAPRAGTFTLGLGVSIAFFAQHVVEALAPGDTVLSSLEKAAHPSVRPQEILNLAGSLLFSGDDTRKPVSILSGGEKTRVALGRVLLQKAPCLVLDEPTNHLDFQTVEALTNALREYPGTVIVVSHDRGFIKRVGTKILEVSNGEVHLYPGTYEEYVWSVQQRLAREPETDAPIRKAARTENARTPAPESSAAASVPKNWKDAKKDLERRLRLCEKRLRETETELHENQERMTALNEKIAAESIPTSAMIQDLSQAGSRVAELEPLWLELAEEREILLRQLQTMTS